MIELSDADLLSRTRNFEEPAHLRQTGITSTTSQAARERLGGLEFAVSS